MPWTYLRETSELIYEFHDSCTVADSKGSTVLITMNHALAYEDKLGVAQKEHDCSLQKNMESKTAIDMIFRHMKILQAMERLYRKSHILCPS